MQRRKVTIPIVAVVTASLVLGGSLSSAGSPQPPTIVPFVAAFPSNPQPNQAFDWRQRTLDFDAFVYDWDAPGDYPTIALDSSPHNTSVTYMMPSYYGDDRIFNIDGTQEAITMISSVVSGSLVGIDKSNQDGYNYVDMLRTFFYDDLGVALNGQIDFDDPGDPDTAGEGGGTTWWYTTTANVLYYMVGAQYPNASGMSDILRDIADSYAAMVDDIGGASANFYSQGYDFRAGEKWYGDRNEGGDGAIGAAAILLWAYDRFGDPDYLQRAKWAMDWVERSNGHQNYEVLPNLGPYVAARLNAEHGTHYDITRLYNDLVVGSTERWDWGTSIGSWNGYDVSALQGQRNGYAYSMNSFAGALMVPTAKYDARYADTVGRWMLTLSNNAQVFYADRLPASKQAHGSRFVSDPARVIPYEGLKLSEAGVSPRATSDVPYYGLNAEATHLSVYSGAWAGFLGATVAPTNVAGVQRIDLNALDFYGDNAYPTYLYYNPATTTANVQVTLPSTSSVYDAVTDTVLVNSASGSTTIAVPPGSSRVVVLAPANPTLVRANGTTSIGGHVVGHHTGPADLAYNRPVTASSQNGPNVASHLTDGTPVRRWESAASDPQWLQVDLGSVGTINRVVLDWEQASAKAYSVLVSANGSSWTQVFAETNGNGGTDVVTFPPVAARYVHVAMTQRNFPQWAYSMYDLHVYRDDLAASRPTTVSSTTNGNVGAYLTDGNPGTRWESQQIDPSGVQVDLGAATTVGRVVLNWEAAYARDFEVWTSTNGTDWTTVAVVADASGGSQPVVFTPVNARYVFVYMTERGTQWAYSMYDLEVYSQ
jgi:hypothetical protein